MLLTREAVLYCVIDKVFREKATFACAYKLFLVSYFPYNVVAVSSQSVSLLHNVISRVYSKGLFTNQMRNRQ